MKDSDKLKLMLLAWNYHNNQGKHGFTHTITQQYFVYFLLVNFHKISIRHEKIKVNQLYLGLKDKSYQHFNFRKFCFYSKIL